MMYNSNEYSFELAFTGNMRFSSLAHFFIPFRSPSVHLHRNPSKSNHNQEVIKLVRNKLIYVHTDSSLT